MDGKYAIDINPMLHNDMQLIGVGECRWLAGLEYNFVSLLMLLFVRKFNEFQMLSLSVYLDTLSINTYPCLMNITCI